MSTQLGSLYNVRILILWLYVLPLYNSILLAHNVKFWAAEFTLQWRFPDLLWVESPSDQWPPHKGPVKCFHVMTSSWGKFMVMYMYFRWTQHDSLHKQPQLRMRAILMPQRAASWRLRRMHWKSATERRCEIRVDRVVYCDRFCDGNRCDFDTYIEWCIINTWTMYIDKKDHIFMLWKFHGVLFTNRNCGMNR